MKKQGRWHEKSENRHVGQASRLSNGGQASRLSARRFSMKRIIVGITGASGVIYGVRTLETLHKLGVETHLIISSSGVRNLDIEQGQTIDKLHSMASYVNDFE